MIILLIKKSLKYFICFVVCYSVSYSQDIAAYKDYKNYFLVFDNGISRELEYLPVRKYETGGNCILYAGNNGDFKGYYNGSSYELADIVPERITGLDDFGVYYNNLILSIFDKGKNITLGSWTQNYVTGDSIAGCYDEKTSTYNIYYQGHKESLPDIISANALSNIKAGDNLLVYTNTDGFLKVYYHGAVINLGVNRSPLYEAGCNIVAYTDVAMPGLKIFYHDTIYTAEEFNPRSFRTGDNLVAYVDNTANFKIFYKGTTTTIYSYEPHYYEVRDNLVIYGYNNNFNVFHKGKIYHLEDYIPDSYQADASTVVYKDNGGNLKIFYDGKTTLSSERVNKIELNRNVVLLYTWMNEIKIFCRGKFY